VSQPRLDDLLSHERPPRQKTGLTRLFDNRRSMLRSIVAAEVLGKPRALDDEYS
jgi:hypothetical protein